MKEIKEYRRISFVTDKFKEITKAIHKVDEDTLGWVETYYKNGWLCSCGAFYAQRLPPKCCWLCEENARSGMSISTSPPMKAI